MEQRKKIASLIRQKREEKHLSKTDLAKQVGCARYTIIRIEQAEYSPNFDLIVKICKVLGIKKIPVD